MADRAELTIVGLVLVAVGLVLAAPLLGRYGAQRSADAAMGIGAAAGVVAFVVTLVQTLRAAREKRR